MAKKRFTPAVDHLPKQVLDTMLYGLLLQYIKETQCTVGDITAKKTKQYPRLHQHKPAAGKRDSPSSGTILFAKKPKNPV